MPTIIAWMFGGKHLLYYHNFSRVKSIPNEPIEAAKIDGASEWKLHDTFDYL